MAVLYRRSRFASTCRISHRPRPTRICRRAAKPKAQETITLDIARGVDKSSRAQLCVRRSRLRLKNNSPALHLEDFLQSLLRQGDHLKQMLIREGLVLGAALEFDELALVGHDDVEIDFGRRVVDVVEVERGDAVANADRDRRDPCPSGTAAPSPRCSPCRSPTCRPTYGGLILCYKNLKQSGCQAGIGDSTGVSVQAARSKA